MEQACVSQELFLALQVQFPGRCRLSRWQTGLSLVNNVQCEVELQHSEYSTLIPKGILYPRAKPGHQRAANSFWSGEWQTLVTGCWFSIPSCMHSQPIACVSLLILGQKHPKIQIPLFTLLLWTGSSLINVMGLSHPSTTLCITSPWQYERRIYYLIMRCPDQLAFETRVPVPQASCISDLHMQKAVKKLMPPYCLRVKQQK